MSISGLLLQTALPATQESVRATWWVWVATLVIVAALGAIVLLAVMRGLRPGVRSPVRPSGRALRPVDPWTLAGRRLKEIDAPIEDDGSQTERQE